AWQAGSLLLGPYVLPSPLATVGKLTSIMRSPDFSGHAWETARAFGMALVIALAGGLAAGIALGAHRLSGDVAEPMLAALYAIPKITLYPVILLIAGLGIWARVTFGVIHGIIPVVLFTMNAVRNVPPVYLRAARSMRLPLWQVAATVIARADVLYGTTDGVGTARKTVPHTFFLQAPLPTLRSLHHARPSPEGHPRRRRIRRRAGRVRDALRAHRRPHRLQGAVHDGLRRLRLASRPRRRRPRHLPRHGGARAHHRGGRLDPANRRRRYRLRR